MAKPQPTAQLPLVPRLLFFSRWLQLPLYVGLILALGVYVFHFWVELVDLVGAAMGNQTSLQHLLEAVAVRNPIPPEGGIAAAAQIGLPKLTETTIMLVVLSLIDVVMIANLLIMVIVGGYETFVSRMYLEDHPDHPEWLSHVNASVLKVKLALAIIGISSIHLLRTFINADAYSVKALIAQTAIHLTFLLSAMAIAYTDRMMTRTIHDYAPANDPASGH
ncbi:MAG: YqhA family protein [Burkholderiales bacterium]|nr:YqhA family protein [Burkholderiales bacterium]